MVGCADVPGTRDTAAGRAAEVPTSPPDHTSPCTVAAGQRLADRPAGVGHTAVQHRTQVNDTSDRHGNAGPGGVDGRDVLSRGVTTGTGGPRREPGRDVPAAGGPAHDSRCADTGGTRRPPARHRASLDPTHRPAPALTPASDRSRSR